MLNVIQGMLLIDHIAALYTCSGMEEVDATVNSDDETDFSKMDLVNY